MGQAAGALGQAVGSVVGAVGQIWGGYYEAQVARNQAKVDQYNARLKLQQGQQAEMAQRLKTASLIGTQKAGFAGSNIDIATGSPLDVFGNTAMLGELDALTLRWNAEGEALGLRNQAAALHSQANADITAGWITGITTILGSATDISSKWQNFPTDEAANSGDFFGAGGRMGAEAGGSEAVAAFGGGPI